MTLEIMRLNNRRRPGESRGLPVRRATVGPGTGWLRLSRE